MIEEKISKPIDFPSLSQEDLEIIIYGLRIIVSSNDPSVMEWLRPIFPSNLLPVPTKAHPFEPEATLKYHVHVCDDGCSSQPLHTVTRGGHLVYETRFRRNLLDALERAITVEAARHLGANHLVHGGAVVRNRRGVLLPASSGSGKSTIVAALALSGFDFFSDEVAILTKGGYLLPFPKAISLKEGGWQAISAIFPQASLGAAPSPTNGGSASHLIPPKLPSSSMVESGCYVDLVVLPRYAPQEATSLQPVSKTAALARLVQESLNLSLLGKDGFDILFDVVQRAKCYALTTNNLTQAVQLLEGLLDEAPKVEQTKV